MLLAVSGLAAVVLLLLALRITQRLTLRFKLLAGVSVSRQPQKACPHLGSSADPFSHGSQPTDDHRCYLWMQRDRIDLVHQKGFCLTTAHHKCPWLMIRRPDAPPPLRQRLPRLVAAAPRAAWGGLRLAPGAVMAFVAARRAAAASPASAGAGRREAARRLPWPAFAALGLLARGAVQALGRRAEAGGPRLATFAARAGAALLLAALWTGRMLSRLAILAARGLGWLLPRIGRGVAWCVQRLAAAIAARRERAARAREALAASVVSLPILEAAAISPVAIEDAVAPAPSLSAIEELLAEGLAALDRGQESLAYQLFSKATEQKMPRGAGEAFQDAMKRAWFWRAKTSETLEDVVTSLEQALRFEPANLQMQAHLAWARQRQERERKLLPIEQAAPAPATASQVRPPSRVWMSLGNGARMAGGIMALALAALWMTTAVMPALGRFLSQLPAGDELLLRRLILTLNAAALPGQGHLPLPVLNYDLGLSLPFVMAFAFVFTARGLMDGDGWARTMGLCMAGLGGWLCAAAVTNPDASRLGLGLCLGIIVAAVVGRFESPRLASRNWVGY